MLPLLRLTASGLDQFFRSAAFPLSILRHSVTKALPGARTLQRLALFSAGAWSLRHLARSSPDLGHSIAWPFLPSSATALGLSGARLSCLFVVRAFSGLCSCIRCCLLACILHQVRTQALLARSLWRWSALALVNPPRGAYSSIFICYFVYYVVMALSLSSWPLWRSLTLVLGYYSGAQPPWLSVTLALIHCGVQLLFWRSALLALSNYSGA